MVIAGNNKMANTYSFFESESVNRAAQISTEKRKSEIKFSFLTSNNGDCRQEQNGQDVLILGKWIFHLILQ